MHWAAPSDLPLTDAGKVEAAPLHRPSCAEGGQRRQKETKVASAALLEGKQEKEIAILGAHDVPIVTRGAVRIAWTREPGPAPLFFPSPRQFNKTEHFFSTRHLPLSPLQMLQLHGRKKSERLLVGGKGTGPPGVRLTKAEARHSRAESSTSPLPRLFNNIRDDGAKPARRPSTKAAVPRKKGVHSTTDETKALSPPLWYHRTKMRTYILNCDSAWNCLQFLVFGGSLLM